MTTQLTRDQIMRGKNIDPASRLARAKKGAAASPWSKGPTVHSKRVAEIFAANRPKKKVGRHNP